MGNNYYIRLNHCKECNRCDRIHIGKSSFGWKFAVELRDEYYVNFSEFKKFIKDQDIVNEYDEKITSEEFLILIDNKKNCKSHFEDYPKARFIEDKNVDFLIGEFS